MRGRGYTISLAHYKNKVNIVIKKITNANFCNTIFTQYYLSVNKISASLLCPVSISPRAVVCCRGAELVINTQQCVD